VFKHRPAQQLDRRVPQVVRILRRGQNGQPAGAVGQHHVRPTPADVDLPGLDRQGRARLHDLQSAQLIQPVGEGPGERPRHVLRHQHRPGEVRRQPDKTISKARGPPVDAPITTKPSLVPLGAANAAEA